MFQVTHLTHLIRIRFQCLLRARYVPGLLHSSTGFSDTCYIIPGKNHSSVTSAAKRSPRTRTSGHTWRCTGTNGSTAAASARSSSATESLGGITRGSTRRKNGLDTVRGRYTPVVMVMGKESTVVVMLAASATRKPRISHVRRRCFILALYVTGSFSPSFGSSGMGCTTLGKNRTGVNNVVRLLPRMPTWDRTWRDMVTSCHTCAASVASLLQTELRGGVT